MSSTAGHAALIYPEMYPFVLNQGFLQKDKEADAGTDSQMLIPKVRIQKECCRPYPDVRCSKKGTTRCRQDFNSCALFFSSGRSDSYDDRVYSIVYIPENLRPQNKKRARCQFSIEGLGEAHARKLSCALVVLLVNASRT